MYNNVYQEYINNMIGGTIPRNPVEFPNNTYISRNPYSNYSANNSNELENLYPDLYKLLYPMIQSACMRNTRPISEEVLEEMVRDIYSNFSSDEISSSNQNLANNAKIGKTSQEEADKRNIRPNNPLLRDLIRILLIRELIGRPGNFPPNFNRVFI